MIDETGSELKLLLGLAEQDVIPPKLAALVDRVEEIKHVRQPGVLGTDVLSTLIVLVAVLPEMTLDAGDFDQDLADQWGKVRKGTKVRALREGEEVFGELLGYMATKGPNKGKLRIAVEEDTSPHRWIPATDVSVAETVGTVA